VAWIRGGDPGGDIVVWDLQKMTQVACFKGHAHQITRVMFAGKPGEFISSSLDGTVKIWLMNTGVD
jgi:WD40 repeat protein